MAIHRMLKVLHLIPQKAKTAPYTVGIFSVHFVIKIDDPTVPRGLAMSQDHSPHSVQDS